MTTEEFNIYIGQIRGRMLRFASTILRNRADAEDVVSSVSERLWRERERLEQGSRATAFALTSVRNGCYDHSRYRGRRLDQQPDESIATQVPNTDTVEMVRTAMGMLPERQREILHLKDIEGYTTHEIAELYQIEESNVRMILSRARVALKEIIIKTMQR